MTADPNLDLKRRHFRNNVLLSYKEYTERFPKDATEAETVVIVMLDGEVLSCDSHEHFQVIWTRPRDCVEAVPIVDYDGACKASGAKIKAFGIMHRNWQPDYRTSITFSMAFRSFCIK